MPDFSRDAVELGLGLGKCRHTHMMIAEDQAFGGQIIGGLHQIVLQRDGSIIACAHHPDLALDPVAHHA